MYIYSKQAQHRLAPFYRLCRVLLRWIEEPGNVLAALGLFLALSVLLTPSAGSNDERNERQLASAGGGGVAQSDFWTLHDAAMIDGPGSSADVTQCAPAADDAAAPDCAESSPDDGGTQLDTVAPLASLQPFRWSWQPRGAEADLRAITAH